MKKYVLAFAASGAALCAAVPASASEIVQIDTANSSIRVTSNPRTCILGSCALSAGLAFSTATPLSLPAMNLGDVRTFDFANFALSRGFGMGSAVLDATLAFINPAGEITSGGTSNYFRAGGFFTPGVAGGTLTWSNPTQQLTATNGSKYTVTLNNIGSIGFGNTAIARATISFDSIAAATAVPEPATWALMMLGVGAIGGVMRRRPKVSTAVRFA